jgi:cytochrome c oxidase subunit 1
MSTGDDGHHGPTNFWTKYVFSTDHKVIGTQFLFVAMLFVILGGGLALGVRYQLAWPQQDLAIAEILPGTGTDPGAKGPKMTNVVPESNPAHWQLGHESKLVGPLILSEDGKTWKPFDYPALRAEVAKEKELEDGPKLDAAVEEALAKKKIVPPGVKGSITGFPLGVAVTIPVNTQIQRPDASTPYTLAEPMDAFIDRNLVIGGYKSLKRNAIAAVGSTIHQQDPDGGYYEDSYSITGKKIHRPSGAIVIDGETALLLPTRAAATLVDLEFAAQTVPVTSAEELNNFSISAKQKNEIRDELAGIINFNEKKEADRNTALNKLAAQIQKAKEKEDEFAPAVKKLEKRSEAVTLQYNRQLKKQEVMVDIQAGALKNVSATNISYKKHSLTPDAYNQFFTMHATIMIFFVIIPALVGAFGNFLIPLMIGARDMAFPKLNMLSYWLFAPSGLIMIASFWTMGGGAGGAAGAGWTSYPPLSEADFSANLGTTLWLLAVFIVGFSSIVGSMNYVTTIINMRAPGMSMNRLPLTVWAALITTVLQVFGTPLLAASGIMLLLDRTMGTTFFLHERGGQPLLWQHLFWFYSHPAVYIMILPAMGIASDVMAVHARKAIFGYMPMVYALSAITGLGFIVWGHHMFQSGMNPVLGTTFTASTIMIAVPSAVKIFNWLGTLWGGNIKFTPAMLFALGFVSMFTIGGLSGIFMASAPVDIHIHDTYFIVAHIHYVLFGGSIMGIFAGVYHWFPKIFGRQMNQKWGVIHFIMTIIAFNGTFFLMHVLGAGGHPRRYNSIELYPSLEHLQPMNVMMTFWALAMGMAQIPFAYNFFVSIPRKLGRAMVAMYICGLLVPTIIGRSVWGVSDEGLGILQWSSAHPEFGFSFAQILIGNFALWGALGYFGFSMFKGLPLGGKIPQCILLAGFALMWMCYALGGEFPFTSLGYGFIWGGILTLIVFVVWEIGGVFKAPQILQRLMYLVFLPAYLSPMILKQDLYLKVGMAELHQYRWMIMLAFAMPGLIYLVIRRPRDEFGAIPSDNPWFANSLEWETTSPPIFLNFEKIPTVYRGPYEYGSPVVEEDYLPQTTKLPPGVVEPTGH